ncbi:MAG: HrpE/YscL family type III secretion apparatus protein [Waddliaceae bacterium]|jgi:type III secretion protein L|nr:HrpE/YscL family type III secretion apparatus protein [Waddliaceae bacterium]MBT3579350.1 HrpE/YscL family type III secretion apparatus protein [Waddliaceae bacterium]MBT4444840.1 HrpE/YscL family type III secretion apparatus protein [Waddliaceae bacterium]MBT6928024.1 HrpE/YscL family type III secretion apparatus protein [Waddliaceae bacterium]MBT7264300.1 HrpE/YscL family type III secretion apparatus protein [Waddliaceae bacterium]
MVKESKLFSLIYSGDVHLSSEEKVIPKEDISAVFSAKEMLKKVDDDAERYKKEVSEECERLKEAAQEEGFAEGQKRWNEQIILLEKRRRRVRREMEKIIIPIAIKAAKKIVGDEMSLNEEAIVNIVSNTLRAVSQHQKIIIYVNKNDKEVLDKNKSRLNQIFERLESLSIQEREDVAPGGCIIETEAGIINAQIDNQWRRLEAAFQKVVQKEK